MKGLLLLIPISIGNIEHKHTRYNKLEKTTDSRKTLTGCGLFSFLQKKYIVPQQVRKMGKSLSNSRLFLLKIVIFVFLLYRKQGRLQINLSYITDETKFLKMGTVTLCIQQSLLFCQSCYTLMDWHWQTIYGIDACFWRFHDIQLLSIPSASLQ